MRTKAARITQAQYPFFRPKRNFNRMPRVLALQSQVQSRQIQSTIEGVFFSRPHQCPGKGLPFQYLSPLM